MSGVSSRNGGNVVKTDNGSFSGQRKPSIPPLPSVIDIESLEQALYPTLGLIENGKIVRNQSAGSESRGPTPINLREPTEISFLSEIAKLGIKHNFRDECLNCGQQSIYFFTPQDEKGDEVLLMRGIKDLGCTHQNFEIVHVLSRELVLLVEIIQGTWFSSLPNRVEIYGPPGRSLGFVDRYSSCGSSSIFEIRDASGDLIYTVQSKWRCFGPTEYLVISKGEDNSQIAELVSSSSCSGEMLSIAFIENVPPSRKALIIGLALLVDMVQVHERLVAG